jgi:hypothetical protein
LNLRSLDPKEVVLAHIPRSSSVAAAKARGVTFTDAQSFSITQGYGEQLLLDALGKIVAASEIGGVAWS